MNRDKSIRLLMTDVDGWNKYRGDNLDWVADLRWADLRWADLRWANLRRANLGGADLRWADLRWADLRWANLRRADLGGADLGGANLEGSCLDPAAGANGDVEGFELDGEYIIGYRTASRERWDGGYVAGRCYSAPWFSVSATECHPGLYLGPSVAWLEANNWSGPYVRVWARPADTHRAGGKWRTRCFYRVEDVVDGKAEG